MEDSADNDYEGNLGQDGKKLPKVQLEWTVTEEKVKKEEEEVKVRDPKVKANIDHLDLINSVSSYTDQKSDKPGYISPIKV